VAIPPIETPPIAPATVTLTHMSEYAFRNIGLDVGFNHYDKVIKLDDYKGLLDHEPKSINEIRAKLRNYRQNNVEFPTRLGDKLGPLWSGNVPDENVLFGRTVTTDPTVRYGQTPLGNNPVDNRSKRFKPKDRI